MVAPVALVRRDDLVVSLVNSHSIPKSNLVGLDQRKEGNEENSARTRITKSEGKKRDRWTQGDRSNGDMMKGGMDGHEGIGLMETWWREK